MKWHWVISCSDCVEDPLVTEGDNIGSSSDDFFSGVRWSGRDAGVVLTVFRERLDGDPDDALQNHLGLPIVSERLRNGFEREGIRGCEYVPVVVKRPKGTTVRGFSIVNVLSRRAALHREQSVFDVFPPDYMFADQRGAIRSLRRTVLRREAIADTDFLRLDEYPFALYVSEAVTRVFQRLGCTGWSFVEVSTR